MWSRKKRGLFNPKSKEPFRLSRSKLELFLECPQCFYLDRRLGIHRPGGLPFTLNSAVDALLKREFDIHRAKGEAHPLMKSYKIDAIPFNHENLNKWRENFKGVEYYHSSTNLIIFGAVDDIWINDKEELMVVDYKATSTSTGISLDDEYRQSFKRQMEIYIWLLKKNGFKVSNTGYFVYCNGRRDAKAFDGRLEFDVEIIPYNGNDNWVEEVIIRVHQCLNSKKVPLASPDCEFCQYVNSVAEAHRH